MIERLAALVIAATGIAWALSASRGLGGAWFRSHILGRPDATLPSVSNVGAGIGAGVGSVGGGIGGGVGGTLGRLDILNPVPGATVNAPGGCFHFDRGTHLHAGIDLLTPHGTPYRSPADGVVIYAGPGSTSCGHLIGIDHGDGVKTWGCHMADFIVSAETAVRRGQPVAHTGGTPGSVGAGNSGAPHVHFEVELDGTDIDPAPLIGITCGGV